MIITDANLATTNVSEPTGKVNSVSSVPERCSSLHCRMVKAEIRKISRMGIHRKRPLSSARPPAKKASTQKKVYSVNTRNTPRKIKAMGEPK